ncbi:rhodanese-like domain-containing protein [Methylovirgula sp. 4M-Z18]|uniref:rhodanese-like domain-containing protein n=1 Tax=Methylovirgula sp. 4M-Z18 TaxID=2293567 RepID=UPI000E2EB13B|nr:rhodanese-like domain-containing protein [Methylovirgula sp. 4M-Z18]RFB78542.1 rhodanese-like domain-containing protein [Methylovirgula sp. 4M-Z18]
MNTEAGYAGDVTAVEAFDLLKQHADAQLVDVRTRAEWSFVGLPDLSSVNRDPICIEWQQYPSMVVATNFADVLDNELRARGIPSDAPILFLCRSGARSLAAARALTTKNYSQCFNISGGFEGPPDTSRHRGMVDGWKAHALPWIQS